MVATLMLNALVASLGLALIVGACRRWKWLVDPPITLVPQTWLNRVFGVTASVVYICALGAAIVLLAVWGSWLVCCR
jgi:hypothetical protein